VTVTNVRTNTSVRQTGARFLLPGRFALGAQHGKLYASLRTTALFGTPYVKSVHDNYLFAMEDVGRLAPMAAELVDLLAILVAARRFRDRGPTNYRSLSSDSYVQMQHFVRRSTHIPFHRRFWGDVRR
jgi:hypothetical protein